MKTIILILSIITLTFSLGGQDDPGFKLYLETNNNVLKSNWTEAIKLCDELIKKFPNSGYCDDAYFWKAYSLKEQKKYTESIGTFSSLIERFPSTSYKSDAINNLNLLRSKVGNADQKRIDQINRSSGILYRNTGDRSVYVTEGNAPVFFDEVNFPELSVSTDIEGIADLADVEGIVFDEAQDFSGIYVGSSSRLTPEEEIEVEAIRSYYNAKRSDSKSGLNKIMTNSKKSEAVKNEALKYYMRVEDDFDKIEDIYKREKSVLLKRTILSNLYRYKDSNSDDVKDFTSDILSDSKATYDIKKSALYSLSRLDNIYDELEVAYEKNDHISLRKSIISTMTRKYPNESKDFIMEIIKDKSEKESIRKSAVYYLSRNLKDLDRLKSLYSNLSGNENLQKEVVYSLYKIDSNESIDYMISLLKSNSTSAKVKKSIIYYLGRSKNPKATKAISDLLFD